MRKLVVGILGGLFGFLLFSCSETEANIAISPVEGDQRDFWDVNLLIDDWAKEVNKHKMKEAAKFFVKDTGTMTLVVAHPLSPITGGTYIGRQAIEDFLQGAVDSGAGDVNIYNRSFTSDGGGVIKVQANWSTCQFGSGTKEMKWIDENYDKKGSKPKWLIENDTFTLINDNIDTDFHSCDDE